MGLKEHVPAPVELPQRFSQRSQCGTKIRWPSRWVAENAALLTTWANPDDDIPRVAYACPWCSVPGDPGFHTGHDISKGDHMPRLPESHRLAVVQWLEEVAPELDPKLVSQNVTVAANGNVHLTLLSRDADGRYQLDEDGEALHTTALTIKMSPGRPPFPTLLA